MTRPPAHHRNARIGLLGSGGQTMFGVRVMRVRDRHIEGCPHATVEVSEVALGRLKRQLWTASVWHPVAFGVTPTKVLSFGKDPDSQTGYRFTA